MVQANICSNINPCGDQVFNYCAKFDIINANQIYLWLLDNVERTMFNAVITTSIDANTVYFKVKFKNHDDYARTVLTWS